MNSYNLKVVEILNSNMNRNDNIVNMFNTLFNDVKKENSNFDTTTLPNTEIKITKTKILPYEYNFLYGSDFSSYDTQHKNTHFTCNINDILSSEIQMNFFHPNQESNISISSKTHLDLTPMLSMIKSNEQLDIVDNLYAKEYTKNIVEAVVIRKGFTFISNLKQMTKDTQFDEHFKNNINDFDKMLLEKVVLIAPYGTKYKNKYYDMDDLNLNKLNIGIINSKDQYVSYNAKTTLTAEELEFIRNQCLLKYYFVNKYNSSNDLIITKKLLIGV